MKRSNRLLFLVAITLLFSHLLSSEIISHEPILELKSQEQYEFSANSIGTDSVGEMYIYIKTDRVNEYVAYKMNKIQNRYTYQYFVPEDIDFVYYYLEYKNKTIINLKSAVNPYIVKIIRSRLQVILLDPEEGETYIDNRVLVSISLFNTDLKDIENLSAFIDNKLEKCINLPENVLYVFESKKLRRGSHKIEISVNDKMVLERKFYIYDKNKIQFKGSMDNNISLNIYSGDSSIYNNQDTTLINGYSIADISTDIGNSIIRSGYNFLIHNRYRNKIYVGFENNWLNVYVGDFFTNYTENYLNSISLRGITLSAMKFYLFNGSKEERKDGSITGTDTTFGIFREVVTSFGYDSKAIKIGFLYARDDTNSIDFGLSPIQNIISNFTVKIPIGYFHFYTNNSISLTTRDNYLIDSLMDFNLLFFHLNPSTIPLTFNGLPFLSNISGVEFNKGIARVLFEYYRKGSGYVNATFNRTNQEEHGFRIYNSLFFSGFTFTGNIDFKYPENQNLKNVNFYFSKNISKGYIFSNISFTNTKSLYLDSVSSNMNNLYTTIGGSYNIWKLQPLSIIYTNNTIMDLLDILQNETINTIYISNRIYLNRRISVSGMTQIGFSNLNGLQLSLSGNVGMNNNHISGYSNLGIFKSGNSSYIYNTNEISYDYRNIKPTLGIYLQKSSLNSSSYGLFKIYFKLFYVF